MFNEVHETQLSASGWFALVFSFKGYPKANQKSIPGISCLHISFVCAVQKIFRDLKVVEMVCYEFAPSDLRLRQFGVLA